MNSRCCFAKFYNARAEPLFCSLNLLFYHVRVAVAVVVCLKSLLLTGLWQHAVNMYGPDKLSNIVRLL